MSNSINSSSSSSYYYDSTQSSTSSSQLSDEDSQKLLTVLALALNSAINSVSEGQQNFSNNANSKAVAGVGSGSSSNDLSSDSSGSTSQYNDIQDFVDLINQLANSSASGSSSSYGDYSGSSGSSYGDYSGSSDSSYGDYSDSSGSNGGYYADSSNDYIQDDQNKNYVNYNADDGTNSTDSSDSSYSSDSTNSSSNSSSTSGNIGVENYSESDPAITITNNSSEARTYDIVSGANSGSNCVPPGGSSQQVTLQPGESVVYHPGENWSGAITDNNGTRQEFTFDNGTTWYDSDYEMGINNSTISPTDSSGETGGETDYLSKVNSAWQNLDSATKEQLVSGGYVDTDSSGNVTSINPSKDDAAAPLRQFLMNDAKVNGYSQWNDDTHTHSTTGNKFDLNSY